MKQEKVCKSSNHPCSIEQASNVASQLSKLLAPQKDVATTFFRSLSSVSTSCSYNFGNLLLLRPSSMVKRKSCHLAFQGFLKTDLVSRKQPMLLHCRPWASFGGVAIKKEYVFFSPLVSRLRGPLASFLVLGVCEQLRKDSHALGLD